METHGGPNQDNQAMMTQGANPKETGKALFRTPKQHPRRTQTRDVLDYPPKTTTKDA